MTYKEQIISDGVNVRNCKGIDLSLSPLVKCKFLKFKTSDGGIAGIWCSDHTNCYYKQLARKTKECEDLREALKEEVIYKRTYLKSLLDCKEECEKLKKEITDDRKEFKLLNKLITSLGYNINEIEDIFDYEEFCEHIMQEQKALLKKAKALTEIERVCLKSQNSFYILINAVNVLKNILEIVNKSKEN